MLINIVEAMKLYLYSIYRDLMIAGYIFDRLSKCNRH